MIAYPKAKINLGLNVVARRPDGYHDLETVFLPIDVTDELEITPLNEDGSYDTSDADAQCKVSSERVVLEVEGVENLCEPQKNLVYKAYMLLAQHYDLPPVRIRLRKNIPSQAGMGGGSSDAAYTLTLLREMFQLPVTDEQLQAFAAQLGADCALFIKAVPAYATGIGDRLTDIGSIEALKGKTLLLVKPNVAVSTKEAYAGITPRQPQMNCLEALRQPIETWQQSLVNDFEEGIFQKLPILAEVKQAMYDDGAIYAAMSGSGSTIFGIFDSNTFNPQSPLLTDASKQYIKTITL